MKLSYKEIKVSKENYALLINWWENSVFIYTNYNDLKIIQTPSNNKPYGIIKVKELMYNFLIDVCSLKAVK